MTCSPDSESDDGSFEYDDDDTDDSLVDDSLMIEDDDEDDEDDDEDDDDAADETSDGDTRSTRGTRAMHDESSAPADYATGPAGPAGPARGADRRERNQILKKLRRTLSDDCEETAVYLEQCPLADCRTFVERHAEVEALRSSHSDAMPMRVQLYNRLPHLPAASALVLERRVRQLEHTDEYTAEGAKLRAWVKMALSVPYGVYLPPPSGTDVIGRVRARLDATLHGQAAAKNRVLELVAQSMSNPTARPRIIGLVGPPGVGKTSLGRALGEGIDRPLYQINLGGCGDAGIITGHTPTYDAAESGQLLKALIRTECLNPVILWDEIDKLSNRHSDEVSGALTHALDTSQNCDFVDHFLDLPVDASRALMIVTLNDPLNINKILRDRLDLVEFVHPTVDDKVRIVLDHLLPRVLANCGVTDVTMTAEDARSVVARFPEPGVRGLGGLIETLVRRVNLLRQDPAGDYPFRIPTDGPVRLAPDNVTRLTRGDKEPEINPSIVHMYC